MATVEDTIFDTANALGFAAVGVAEVGASRGFSRYQRWVRDGCAGEMDYLRRSAAARADPRLVAPGARAVIAVAARYPCNTRPEAGGFSTYARGADYHDVLRGKLKALVRDVPELASAGVARVCVDTAPVLEREWAVRAGLGWRGRQGQVVNPRLGCCLVLGLVLTDVELAASPLVPPRCGSCRRCVEACPTQAIDGEGCVDARRCVSYLTIEHKGDVAAPLAARMGGALFGCDRCTAVCPWNRFGADRVMPELMGGTAVPSADECLALSEEAFRRRFRGTAVERTGRERLARNASIACRGNSL